jgi:hypothetical protein
VTRFSRNKWSSKYSTEKKTKQKFIDLLNTHNVNVKLSLYTPWRHIGGGGIAPLICSLTTRWRCCHLPFYPWKSLRNAHGGWVGPEAGLDILDNWYIPCPSQDSNLKS